MLKDFDYPSLATLSAVLRTGSFDRAAAELGVTPSAVSQRIKSLEERMGAVLVLRGQPCTGTDTGRRLARHVEDVRLLEAALVEDLGATRAARPAVRIAVNADSLATWLVPALAAVEGLMFHVVVDDQDHSADWLRRGEVSAAVTAQGQPVQGCDAVPLGRLRYVATASPAFVSRWFPDGLTAAALSAAPALTFDAKDRLQRDWARAACGQDVTLTTHYLPSSTAFVEAALAGMGWGMNPEVLVRHHIAAGRLVALADLPFDTALTWQVSRLMRDAMDPVTRAVRRAARAALLR